VCGRVFGSLAAAWLAYNRPERAGERSEPLWVPRRCVAGKELLGGGKGRLWRSEFALHARLRRLLRPEIPRVALDNQPCRDHRPSVDIDLK
jgi:hypothetical protein